MTRRLDQWAGAWLLQHHDTEFSVNARSAMWAARKIPRPDGLVPWEIQRDSIGDVLCATLWSVDESSPVVTGGGGARETRPIPGWAFVWPTKVKGYDDGAEDDEGGSGSGFEGGKASDPFGQGFKIGGAFGLKSGRGVSDDGGDAGGASQTTLPIRSEAYNADPRFVEREHPLPDWKTPYPTHYHAASIGGTEEYAQEQLLLSWDDSIICPSNEGPGEMGTLWHDFDKPGEMTREGPPGIGGLAARSQTIGRVVPIASLTHLEMDVPHNSVAWMLTATLQDGSLDENDVPSGFGGYGIAYGEQSADVFDNPNGATTIGPAGSAKPKAKKKLGAAYFAHPAAGPMNIGHGKQDKHAHGETEDGEPLTAGHLDTLSFFVDRGDKTRDAPLEFRLEPYEGGDPFKIPTPVFLRYDWRSQHPFMSEVRGGLWRWETYVPYFGSPPDTPEDPPTGDIPPDPEFPT